MRCLTLVILVLCLMCSDSVLAQQKSRRTFQPSRRKFSAYMNLLRTNVGQPLPNYQQYYEPDRLLTNELNQVNDGIRKNSNLIRENNQQTLRLGDQLKRGGEAGQGTRPELRQSRSTVRPTGTGSQYMSFQLQNFSHYYPAGGNRRSRR